MTHKNCGRTARRIESCAPNADRRIAFERDAARACRFTQTSIAAIVAVVAGAGGLQAQETASDAVADTVQAETVQADSIQSETVQAETLKTDTPQETAAASELGPTPVFYATQTALKPRQRPNVSPNQADVLDAAEAGTSVVAENQSPTVAAVRTSNDVTEAPQDAGLTLSTLLAAPALARTVDAGLRAHAAAPQLVARQAPNAPNALMATVDTPAVSPGSRKAPQSRPEIVVLDAKRLVSVDAPISPAEIRGELPVAPPIDRANVATVSLGVTPTLAAPALSSIEHSGIPRDPEAPATHFAIAHEPEPVVAAPSAKQQTAQNQRSRVSVNNLVLRDNAALNEDFGYGVIGGVLSPDVDGAQAETALVVSMLVDETAPTAQPIDESGQRLATLAPASAAPSHGESPKRQAETQLHDQPPLGHAPAAEPTSPDVAVAETVLEETDHLETIDAPTALSNRPSADALATERSRAEAALAALLRHGDVEPVAALAPGVGVASTFRERSIWVGLLELLQDARWRRTDTVELRRPDGASQRFVQLVSEVFHGWSLLDFGEEERARVHAVVPTESAEPAALELRLHTDDLDVWEDELARGYVRFANRLADPVDEKAPARRHDLPDEARLLPFTPELHGYGERWGHLRFTTTLGMGDEGLDALAALEPDAVWRELASDDELRERDLARARRALAARHPVERRIELARIPSRERRIARRTRGALRHLRAAGEAERRDDRVQHVVDALERGVFRSGSSWDPALLGALRRAAGPERISVDTRIEPRPGGRTGCRPASRSSAHRTSGPNALRTVPSSFVRERRSTSTVCSTGWERRWMHGASRVRPTRCATKRPRRHRRRRRRRCPGVRPTETPRSQMPDLIYEKRGHVATLRLNRPQRRNALSPRMMIELGEAWLDFRSDPELRVAVLTGTGEQAFTVGGDLGLLMPLWTGARRPEDEWDRRLLAEPQLSQAALLKDFELYKPIVAAVNGDALAGGTEILQATDIRIAARHARFGLAEVKRGLVPGGGSMVRLPRQIPWCKAMEILLLGDVLPAEEAHRIGLINELVDGDRLMERAQEVADALARNGPLAVQKVKEAALRSSGLPLAEAHAIENECAGTVMRSEDAKEGPRAFMEKREPAFQGR